MKPIVFQITASGWAHGKSQTFEWKPQIPRYPQTKTEDQMDKEKNRVVPSRAQNNTSGLLCIFPA